MRGHSRVAEERWQRERNAIRGENCASEGRKLTRKLVAGEGSRVLAEAKGIEAKVAGLAAGREHSVARHLEAVGEVLDDAAEGEDLPEAALSVATKGTMSHMRFKRQ